MLVYLKNAYSKKKAASSIRLSVSQCVVILKLLKKCKVFRKPFSDLKMEVFTYTHLVFEEKNVALSF